MSLTYAPEHADFNSPAVSCDCLAHMYGNAADHPDRVRRYPSDMTDAEWAAIRPLLPVPAWFQGRCLPLLLSDLQSALVPPVFATSDMHVIAHATAP